MEQGDIFHHNHESAESGPETIHYSEIGIGIKLALPVHTLDGRFVLSGGTVLNKKLSDGLKKLAAGKAVAKTFQVFIE